LALVLILRNRISSAPTYRPHEALTRPNRHPWCVYVTPDRYFGLYLIDILSQIKQVHPKSLMKNGQRKRTCPPGPELREKVSSTNFFGIVFASPKERSQALAPSCSSARDRETVEGGMGRVWISRHPQVAPKANRLIMRNRSSGSTYHFQR
jgi:hypothetical protein